jgi:hypothetical protein
MTKARGSTSKNPAARGQVSRQHLHMGTLAGTGRVPRAPPGVVQFWSRQLLSALIPGIRIMSFPYRGHRLAGVPAGCYFALPIHRNREKPFWGLRRSAIRTCDKRKIYLI